MYIFGPTISGFREILQKLSNLSLTPIIWANKGLEYETSQLPHEIASQILDNSKIKKKFGVLSGPSFAAELVRDLPTAITCASEDTELSKFVAEIFHHGNMRVYMSNDVIGVSVGGALKNVIAIAAGISDGMGFGNNARAALITRGLAEISRFGMAIGASSETFSGLAGAGDLYVSAAGGRNSKMGGYLGMGYTFKTAKKKFMPNDTVEGEQLAREIAPFILKKIPASMIPSCMELALILFRPSSFAIPLIKASIAALGATERTSFAGHLDKPMELRVVYEPPNFLRIGRLFFIILKNPSASVRITSSHSS